MLAGYVLEQIVGIALAAACAFFQETKRESTMRRVCERSLVAFHDCAVFFAFSIQIAATIFLVREDLGISTTGMGNATVRITQAVSVLVLLPLTYLFILNPCTRSSPKANLPLNNKEGSPCEEEVVENQTKIESTSASWRFDVFAMCWAMAFHPFYSNMNYAFGQSLIGSKVISVAQFELVEQMCTTGTNPTSKAENIVIFAFEMLAFIPMSIALVGRFLWLGIEKQHAESKLYGLLQSGRRRFIGRRLELTLRAGCLIAIPLLGCGLLWTILRVRHFQLKLTAELSNVDTDKEWTFGQVVAVTVFAPVIVEVWKAFQDVE